MSETGFKRAEARAKAQKGSGSPVLCDLERYSKTLVCATLKENLNKRLLVYRENSAEVMLDTQENQFGSY